jgi:hypothetical protein
MEANSKQSFSVPVAQDVAMIDPALGITTRQYIATQMMQALIIASRARADEHFDIDLMHADAGALAIVATIYTDALIHELEQARV